MRNDILLFLKGAAMGAANVIPGVSGGTVALVTGIYQRLIDALRAFDHHTAAFLLKRDLPGFARHVDLRFLSALGIGVVASLVTLARALGWLLDEQPVETFAFFFGLILGSVYFVGATVERWGAGPLAGFLIGLAVAVGIALLEPAQANDAPWYLILCGVVAIVSMILPGLSGSYVLLLMGNYRLVLSAIEEFRLLILFWVAVGAAAGLLLFSRLISFLFRRFRNATIALLTGFILGSLVIIWPWKRLPADNLKDVSQYQWYLPDATLPATWLQLGLILLGIAAVWLMERSAGKA
jgi:putative membrane protein